MQSAVAANPEEFHAQMNKIGGEEYETSDMILRKKIMLSKMVHEYLIDEAVALFALYHTNFNSVQVALDYIYEPEVLIS